MRTLFHSFLVWFARKFMVPTVSGWVWGYLCIDMFDEEIPHERITEDGIEYYMWDYYSFTAITLSSLTRIFTIYFHEDLVSSDSIPVHEMSWHNVH